MYDKLRPDQQAQVDQYINYVRPVTLDGKQVSTRNPGAWRTELANWMTGRAQTRRYVVNRLWSIAFGSGLVNPVDDFNPLNDASHPVLLDKLAADFGDHKWSIKRLYRAILNSRAWQLSSKQADPRAEQWHFASYPVRPMNAEQFLASLLRLLDEDNVRQLVRASRDNGIEQAKTQLKRQAEAQPDAYTYDHVTLGRYGDQFKAIDDRWFLARWAAGRYTSLSQDDEMTQGENFSMSINQALAVMNGQFTNSLAGSGRDSLLERISRSFHGYKDRVEALYLTVLARRPTEAEHKRLTTYFRDAESPTEAAEDLLYALLMTTEFATNH
jgi:hypothetical protein